MLSTPNSKANDPHDTLEITPDVVLVARAAADSPSLAPGATGREPPMGSAKAAIPTVDTTFRATDTSGERPSHGRWTKRAAVTFVFALCSALAAAAWENYGDEAQGLIANYTSRPVFSLTSWLPSSLIPPRPA